MNTPFRSQGPTQPDPNTSSPDKDQNLGTNQPDTEINPGQAGNNTEVDLDKTKIKTYPKESPPERQ